MRRFSFLLTLLALSGISGCGGSDIPELGTVSGIVKLEGNPLPNAIVIFTPQGEGRPSSGETDDTGYYSLQYLTDAEGAIIGNHKVTVERITDDASDDLPDDARDLEDGQTMQTPMPVMASDGSIIKEVKSGDNEINIDLTGPGAVLLDDPDNYDGEDG